LDRSEKLNSLTSGTIWKSLVLFVIPIIVSSLFQQLYSAADTIIVGRLVGDEALAAVGATVSLTNMVIGFFLGASAGAGVVIAQYVGARDRESLSVSVHTSMVLAIIGGLILTVGGILLTPSFIRWMDVPDNVFDYASSYLAIIFGGSVPNMVYNMGSGILRAAGDSKRPLYYLAASIVINIVLDIVLVGPLDMGIEGAAWATIISQAIAAVLTVGQMMITHEDYRLSISRLRLNGTEAIHILRVGVPTGLQAVAISFSNLIAQVMVNAFGSDVMAAWAAFNKIDNFIYMPMNSFGIAITTFVGQNFGARRNDRAKKGVNICMAIAVSVGIVMGVLILIFGRPVLGLFSESETVIDAGMVMVYWLMPLYFMYGIIEVMSGALKGVGRTLTAMAITFGGTCVLRLIYLAFSDIMWGTLQSLLFVYPFTWTLTSTAFCIVYRVVFYGKNSVMK